jgi:hypothetical protein
MITRRFILTGLVAAPLVVPAARLMRLRGVVLRPVARLQVWDGQNWLDIGEVTDFNISSNVRPYHLYHPVVPVIPVVGGDPAVPAVGGMRVTL